MKRVRAARSSRGKIQELLRKNQVAFVFHPGNPGGGVLEKYYITPELNKGNGAKVNAALYEIKARVKGAIIETVRESKG